MNELDEYKPAIYLDSDQLPAIKHWMVGEEYEITVRVKQVSIRQSEYGGKKKMSGEFQIISVEAEDNEKDIEDMTNDEFIAVSSKMKQKAYEKK